MFLKNMGKREDRPYDKKLLILLYLMPAVTVCVLYPFLPETMPTHFNLMGIVDDYGSRAEMFLIPAVAVIVLGLILYSLERYGDRKSLWAAGWFCSILVIVVSYGNLYAGYRHKTTLLPSDRGELAVFIVGVLAVMLGIALPFIKPNFIIGIRTRAALDSEEVWKVTHRWAAYVFVLAGGGILLSVVIFPEDCYFLLSVILIAACVLSLIISAVAAKRI